MTELEKKRQLYGIELDVRGYERRIDKAIELEDFAMAREIQREGFGYIKACYRWDMIDKSQYDEFYSLLR